MRWLFVSIFAFSLIASESRAGWGPSGCSAVALPVAAYSWMDFQGDKLLWLNGAQIGGYSGKDGRYYRRLAPGKFEAASVPVDAPRVDLPAVARPCECSKCDECKCTKDKQCEIQNFGVDSSRIQAGNCSINGEPCSHETAYQAVAKSIDDVSQRLHLTAIGPVEYLAKFREAVQSFGLGDKLLCRAFPPDHWAVKDGNYVVPAVYLQNRDGKVLLRRDDGDLKFVVEELRKVDPNYDPKKDRTGGSGVMDVVNQVEAFLTQHAALVAAVVSFVLWRRGFFDSFFTKKGP